MDGEKTQNPSFPGFPAFRANVTFVPIQFFTVVVPHCSRGTVRIVGYALRKVLGWVDDNGNPTREQLKLTYRELIEKAGVSRESIADALREAIERRCLRCIQSPQPDRAGLPAESGIYELCWDMDGHYTDRPDDFRGFYYPAAAVMKEQEGSRVVSRPKAARKNIPNAFFDHLLPRERLSVIRVVGALLFYSIQWGPGGERRVPVSRSITELSRLTKMSRQHVHEAVLAARRAGYIEQLEGGCFDPAAGKESRAATYVIRWVEDGKAGRVLETPRVITRPVRIVVRELEQSEEVNGEPVGNNERDQSEMMNGRRSEKVNGIRIKNELKKQEATTDHQFSPGTFAVADSGFDLLRKEGFDGKTAARLAQRYSQETIQQQIDWLTHRSGVRNRVGFLRRAIEQNWPGPEAAEAGGNNSPLAKQFASHYYAAYHDYAGDAVTEAFPKDIGMAAKFVPRLLAQERDEALIPQWGQRFGRLMREKHQGDTKAKPNLSFALVLYGDEFLRILQREAAARLRKEVGQAREDHQKAFTSAYIAYLHQAESELQQINPSLYETFARHREKLRRLMTSGPFLAAAERLAQFESNENRLLALAAFFEKHSGKPVLSFWDWDVRMNPQRFGANSKRNHLQEARP